MRHTKKARCVCALALCVALPLTLLSGCDYQAIDELVTVIGLGVDYQQETGMYVVTTETAKISASNGQSLESVILTGKGLTLARALEDLGTQASGQMYYQHAEIVVFGEDTAKAGIASIVDTVMRAAPSQKVIKTVVAKGSTAADLFQVKPKAKPFLSSEISDAITVSARRFGASDEGKIHTLYNNIPAGLADVLPVVRIEGEGEDASTVLDGTAVVSGGKLCGYLSYEETKYCLFAMGKLRAGFLTFHSEKLDEPVTFEIESAKVKCVPSLVDGRLTMQIGLEVAGIVPEIVGQMPTVERVKEIDLIEDVRRQVVAGVEQVTRKVISEYGADLFYFRPQVENRYRRQWQAWAQDWPTVFRSAEISCSAQVAISSNGITR